MPPASRLPPRRLLLGVIARAVVVSGAAVAHGASPGLLDPPHRIIDRFAAFIMQRINTLWHSLTLMRGVDGTAVLCG
jgi:hypothetical protein